MIPFIIIFFLVEVLVTIFITRPLILNLFFFVLLHYSYEFVYQLIVVIGQQLTFN